MISAGSRLGAYEILAPIGAGGMGEVYKACDTRLGRDVAIKVLPSSLSSPEMLRRFEREAKTISQLSHPHICALYDVGNQDGVEYLVMEYLEGETLADRIGRGPMPLEQVFRCGVEIAGALDRAHRQGIVHRDLKPGNVMLTKSGVKLLDFGLARGITLPGAVSGETALPTIMGGPPVTEEGTILGTFQYMAPEQLEGRAADARTDIFAFGGLLYEMATGSPAFSGSSRVSLISAILRDDPKPIATFQPMTPPALDRVVKTCLAKDPENRWQSAHDVGTELQWISQAGSEAAIPARATVPQRRRERIWQAVAAAAVVVAAVLAWRSGRRSSSPAPLLRASINLPAGLQLDTENASLVVSPDGRRIAIAASGPDARQKLWLRSLDRLEVQPIPGTDGATYPFWSPDGRNVGFFAHHKLARIDLATGSVGTICDAAEGRGGSWRPRRPDRLRARVLRAALPRTRRRRHAGSRDPGGRGAEKPSPPLLPARRQARPVPLGKKLRPEGQRRLLPGPRFEKGLARGAGKQRRRVRAARGAPLPARQHPLRATDGRPLPASHGPGGADRGGCLVQSAALGRPVLRVGHGSARIRRGEHHAEESADVVRRGGRPARDDRRSGVFSARRAFPSRRTERRLPRPFRTRRGGRTSGSTAPRAVSRDASRSSPAAATSPTGRPTAGRSPTVTPTTASSSRRPTARRPRGRS